jgi:4-hydroxy-tetrahydrodipicolinate synthase
MMNGESFDRLRVAVGGITVTTVSPFLSESLDLDADGARSNLEFLRGSGITSVVPAGNTGEFHSLTGDEIQRLIQLTVETIGDDKVVLVGVGGGLRSAIELAQLAESLGADGIMIHEPSHTFASPAGLDLYYRAICGAISIGVAIYKRTPRLPDALVLELARTVPNVVAIKYALNDVAAYTDLVAHVPEDVVCACGSAERWALPFSAAGTTGYTSGIGNFAPEATRALWEALQDRSAREETMRIWRVFADFEALRARDGSVLNVPAIKKAMDLAGLAGGPPRPPLTPVTREVEAEVAELVARVNALVPETANR